jgi:hypothetical protein
MSAVGVTFWETTDYGKIQRRANKCCWCYVLRDHRLWKGSDRSAYPGQQTDQH